MLLRLLQILTLSWQLRTKRLSKSMVGRPENGSQLEDLILAHYLPGLSMNIPTQRLCPGRLLVWYYPLETLLISILIFGRPRAAVDLDAPPPSQILLTMFSKPLLISWLLRIRKLSGTLSIVRVLIMPILCGTLPTYSPWELSTVEDLLCATYSWVLPIPIWAFNSQLWDNTLKAREQPLINTTEWLFRISRWITLIICASGPGSTALNLDGSKWPTKTIP